MQYVRSVLFFRRAQLWKLNNYETTGRRPVDYSTSGRCLTEINHRHKEKEKENELTTVPFFIHLFSTTTNGRNNNQIWIGQQKGLKEKKKKKSLKLLLLSFCINPQAISTHPLPDRKKERKKGRRGESLLYTLHTHVRYWGRAAQQMVNAHSHCHCHCHAARRVERWVSASSMSSSCSSRCFFYIFFQGKKKSVIECSAGQCSCNCFLNEHGTAVIM